MKILMWPAIWKNPTQQKRKFLLFASKEHPFDLLEAIPLGIAGYINYPFSPHNICHFFPMSRSKAKNLMLILEEILVHKKSPQSPNGD